MAVRKSSFAEGLNEANITPLADVTTTLIVIFLITLPAIMWNGIQVNAAETGSETREVSPADEVVAGLVTLAVRPEGITMDGDPVGLEELSERLTPRLAGSEDRTVVVVPHDAVALGDVVAVLDVAKASGAERLALLNEIGDEAE